MSHAVSLIVIQEAYMVVRISSFRLIQTTQGSRTRSSRHAAWFFKWKQKTWTKLPRVLRLRRHKLSPRWPRKFPLERRSASLHPLEPLSRSWSKAIRYNVDLTVNYTSCNQTMFTVRQTVDNLAGESLSVGGASFAIPANIFAGSNKGDVIGLVTGESPKPPVVCSLYPSRYFWIDYLVYMFVLSISYRCGCFSVWSWIRRRNRHRRGFRLLENHVHERRRIRDENRKPGNSYGYLPEKDDHKSNGCRG